MIMNSNWIYKKIGDVCTVERGGSPRPIDKFITDSAEGINWIKIGDTSDSMYITSTAQKIIPEGMKKSRYVKPGDFLLSNSMSFGRPYILKIDGCIHDGWLVLRDNSNLFDKRFLYYYLSSPSTYQKFKMMAVGGVVNNLNSEMVRGVEIPVPTIDEQIEIANILDRVNGVIANRKQQLANLDELVKARFVELFGDPELNPKGFKTVLLSEIAEYYNGLTYSPDNVSENGTIVLRSSNIQNSQLNFDDTVRVSCNIRDKLLVKNNDILMCSRNGSARLVGKVALIKNIYEPMSFGAFMMIIRSEYYSYLMTYFQMDAFRRQITTGATTTINQITGNMLNKIRLPLPEMEDIKQFETFVEQIDKSKFVVQKALDEAQTLFDSLMQEYFG